MVIFFLLKKSGWQRQSKKWSDEFQYKNVQLEPWGLSSQGGQKEMLKSFVTFKNIDFS